LLEWYQVSRGRSNSLDAVRDLDLAARRITISTRVTPDEVLVAVHDCGPGIPEALAATMFEPFVTTKPDGLGMGLFIVRSIAEAHGGRAFAGNDPDGGAIVGLALRRLGAA